MRIEGMVRWRRHALRNILYPLPVSVSQAVIGLLPHVLPIRGRILQFPGNKGFSLPRDCKSDVGVRVQCVPQHVTEET